MSRRSAIIAALGAASAALLLCAAASPPQTAVSPDGRWRAVVENPSSDQEEGPESVSTLWIEPVAGGPTRVRLRGRPIVDDPKRTLHNFEDPHWSLDGGYVYVSAGAWATSSAVHQVNAATGAEHFVVDANTLQVIRNGPYRGMLLVQRHKYRDSGAYNPFDVVRPDGHLVLTVPGSDRDDGEHSLSRWLSAHGWTAS